MVFSPSIALLRTQSDARLARLAAGGSEAAFAAILERHRRVLAAACRRVVPESRIDDVLQQTFLAAWSALRRGDEIADLRPWMLRIARNTSLNALRVNGYDYVELRDSLRVGEAPQAELERREAVRAALAGLAALPERQRDALMRSAVDGASHAEIAREMGLSEGAVRQLVLRARVSLRAAATALMPWPLATWLAGGGHAAALAPGVAQLPTTAGAAGASALLAKAGLAALVGGAAAGTPAVIGRGHEAHTSRAAAAAAAARQSPARHRHDSRSSTPTIVPVEGPAGLTRPAGGPSRTRRVAVFRPPPVHAVRHRPAPHRTPRDGSPGEGGTPGRLRPVYPGVPVGQARPGDDGHPVSPSDSVSADRLDGRDRDRDDVEGVAPGSRGGDHQSSRVPESTTPVPAATGVDGDGAGIPSEPDEIGG